MDESNLAMEKPDPDFDVARQGFLEGKNHPDDIDGMIWLFRTFRNFELMRTPIAIWAEADVLVEELIGEAEKLRVAIRSDDPNVDTPGPILERINQIYATLTPLEAAFSNSLGESSRRIRDLLLLAMLVIATALTSFGSYCCRIVCGKPWPPASTAIAEARCCSSTWITSRN